LGAAFGLAVTFAGVAGFLADAFAAAGVFAIAINHPPESGYTWNMGSPSDLFN
jgi:hypothetical protein